MKQIHIQHCIASITFLDTCVHYIPIGAIKSLLYFFLFGIHCGRSSLLINCCQHIHFCFLSILCIPRLLGNNYLFI